jgi:hypothetical protein
MPLLESEKREESEENCIICSKSFENGKSVYRPFVNGGPGKAAYHEGCLRKWCNIPPNSNESCSDPVTRIKFNIEMSKITCPYSGPHTVRVYTEDEIIVLGTEPCDRFYEIKKFMSSRYNIEIISTTLWKMKGIERIGADDSEFITEDVDLQLMTMTPLAVKRPVRPVDINDIKKIEKEVEQIKLLERTEDLSPQQITDAAKQSVVEVDENGKVLSEKEIKELDDNILRAEERIKELQRMLYRNHQDVQDVQDVHDVQDVQDVHDELQSNQKDLTILLFARIPILYKEVKGSLGSFLKGSRDFSGTTLLALEKFVKFIVLLLKMGVSVLTLIAKLGWPIVKLIPTIIYYLGYYGVYTPISGAYNLYNEADEPPPVSASSGWGSSIFGGDAPSSSTSSWWGSSIFGDSSSSSYGGAESSYYPPQPVLASSGGWGSSIFGGSSNPPHQEQEGPCKPSKTQLRRYGGYVDCPSGSEQGRYCLPMTLAGRDCDRPWTQLQLDNPYNGDEPVRSKKRDGLFGSLFSFKHSKRIPKQKQQKIRK